MAETKRKVHSSFKPELVAPRALVVGDPNRATEVSKLLDNPQEILNRREYRGYTGLYRGKPVTIFSHGVGSGGAAYLFENLFGCGVKTIIRAGTCGAMIKGVKPGAIMIGTAAVRAEGASEHIAPLAYPAVADYRVVAAIEESAAEIDYPDRHTGIILSNALFFTYPLSRFPRKEEWAEAGNVIAIEQEFAPLLVLASINGARAGGLFTVDGNVVDNTNEWDYHPDQDAVTRGKKSMLLIALNTLAKFD
jgi:uridine phosphorylase